MKEILPKILFVDDLYGHPYPNQDREDLCIRLGLRDITEDAGTDFALAPDPIAEVVFCSGQRKSNSILENDLSEVIRLAKSGWTLDSRWSIAIVDMEFKTDEDVAGAREAPDYFGLEILAALKVQIPDLPTVVFSGLAREEVSLEASSIGAEAFLPRSVGRQEFLEVLEDHALLPDINKPAMDRQQMIGRSTQLLKALRQARRLSKRMGNILISGESGTGKELMARYLHSYSPLAKGPFKVLFTAGVAESMLEAELFGVEAGTFTGQTGARPGAAELADGGTLFIDECGEIPPAVQLKLNRLLEEQTRETQRIGGKRSKKLTVQIVLATNIDLADRESTGMVRTDFLHRIAGQVHLPPLSERPEDIPLLVESFVSRAELRCHARPRIVTPEAMAYLVESEWPGNIRQLRNVIEKAVSEHRSVDYMHLHHLTSSVGTTRPSRATEPVSPAEQSPESPRTIADRLRTSLISESYSDLVGSLPELEKAYAEVVSRLVKAALVATLKETPNQPNGKINPTAAMKCLVGDASLTSRQAMDRVRRLLQLQPDVHKKIVKADSLLCRTWEAALRSRGGRHLSETN